MPEANGRPSKWGSSASFNDILELPTCAKCGATVPPGKKLCWCCEHTPKLHPMDKQSCKSDACDLNLEMRK